LFVPDSSFDILMVDDEPGLLNLAKIYLEMEDGPRVTAADSGSKALKLMASRHFDAIVSDYQMPGMDGIDLLKRVRSEHGYVPFVLFTGRGREDVAIAALNNGADFYIQKGGEPLAQFAELRNAVLQAIQRKGAEELVQNIVDNAPMMIMIVDDERRIRTFNQGVLEFTRMSPREIIGLRCGLAFSCNNSTENANGCGFSSHCEECHLWDLIKKTINQGVGSVRVEVAIRTSVEKGNAELALLVSTAPIRSYGKTMALVFVEDITELRLAERNDDCIVQRSL
jgi:CheY-like chemotaxis protein